MCTIFGMSASVLGTFNVHAGYFAMKTAIYRAYEQCKYGT